MTQSLRLVHEVAAFATSFEGGVAGWTQQTGTDVAQSASFRHAGTYSLKGRNTGSGNNIMNYAITLEAATTYIFTAWVYIGAGEPTLTTAAIRMMTSGFGSIASTDFLTQANATRDAWQQVWVTGTTTTAASYNFNVFFAASAAHNEYMDDPRLYKLLTDFQDVTDYGLRDFSITGFDSNWGAANLTLDVLGTSITDFSTNMERLTRALYVGKQNRNASARGAYYAPLWLQWQPSTSTYMLQTECFGLTDDSDGAIAKVLAVPQTILSNRLENIGLNLRVRGYFEETTPVAVASSPFTVDNSTGSASIASLRGDLPTPLRIKVRAATTNQTQILAALKTQGTVANFINHFNLHTDAGTGYTVSYNATFTAALTDANLVGGKGARVTPTSALDTAGEIAYLVRILITTNPNDHTGRYRALVRMRDNHASAVKAYLRIRSILVDSSGTVLGRSDYWDIARAAGAIGGTTVLPLVDCGVGNLPFADFGGSGVYRLGLEIWGYSLDASFATFDLNELRLEPCHEGEDSGYISVNLRDALGNGAVPDGVISAYDRESDAYTVDASDLAQVNADSVAGTPLFAYPNQTQTLLVMTRKANTGVHTKSNDLTTQVDYVPRYKLSRGA